MGLLLSCKPRSRLSTAAEEEEEEGGSWRRHWLDRCCDMCCQMCVCVCTSFCSGDCSYTFCTHCLGLARDCIAIFSGHKAGASAVPELTHFSSV